MTKNSKNKPIPMQSSLKVSDREVLESLQESLNQGRPMILASTYRVEVGETIEIGAQHFLVTRLSSKREWAASCPSNLNTGDVDMGKIKCYFEVVTD